jgi:hypothetical protein
MHDLVNCTDFEERAAELLDPGVLGYYAGGAGDERTLRDNVAAFARWRLRPRVLVDVSEVSARTTVLGTEVSMPILVAPTALHRMAHADGEPRRRPARSSPSPPSPRRARARSVTTGPSGFRSTSCATAASRRT